MRDALHSGDRSMPVSKCVGLRQATSTSRPAVASAHLDQCLLNRGWRRWEAARKGVEHGDRGSIEAYRTGGEVFGEMPGVRGPRDEQSVRVL